MVVRLLVGIAVASCCIFGDTVAQFTCPPPTPTIKIGMTTGRKPFANFVELKPPTPDPTAFEYNLMKRVCEILGWSCTFIPIEELNDRIAWLNSGEVDIVIAKFSVTQERAYKVRFVFPYYYADSAAVFEMRTGSTANDRGYTGLEGPLCVQEGYYLDKEIAKVGKSKKNWKMVYKTDLESMVEALKAGECQYLVQDSTQAPALLDAHDVYRAPESRQELDHLASPFAIAVSYNSTLHDKIATALNIIMTQTDGRAALEDLEEKFLVDATLGQLRSNNYVRAIVDRQTVVAGAASSNTVLRVGQVMSNQAHPFRYYNETSGLFEANGFENALMMAVCEQMRVQCVFIGLQKNAERIDMLNSNQVDVVASTFTVTADRATQVRFVEPYYYSAGAQLFIPKRSERQYDVRKEQDIRTAWSDVIRKGRMCFLEDYFFVPRLEARGSRVPLNSADQVINGVRGGKCTVLMQDSAYNYLMSENGLKAVPQAGVRDEMPYGIAVRKGNEDLALRLSQALSKLMWDPGQGQSKFLDIERLYVTLQTKGLMEPIKYTRCTAHILEMFHSTCSL